jgi:hypothetical protein
VRHRAGFKVGPSGPRPGRAPGGHSHRDGGSLNDRAAAQWHGAEPTMVLALAVAFKLGFNFKGPS